MSLSSFFVMITLYILIFGVVTGGFAAWMSRAGSSPVRELVSAFRSRAGRAIGGRTPTNSYGPSGS